MAEEYSERYCAFVDILGFRQLIARLGNDSSKVDTLAHILSKVHKPLHPGFADLKAIDYRTQSISDAVAISVVPTLHGLSELFTSLQELALSLLSEGYFIRGAIVRGRLYHDEKMVFGEALIKAYDLETQVVRFPRIMVMSDVVNDTILHPQPAKQFWQHLRPSEDGPMFLHVLAKMQLEMNDSPMGPDNDEGDRFGQYLLMKRLIEMRFRESVDTPRHYEKVQWFAKYWNASLPAKATSFRVLGTGL
jgi:hypothetical protein